jgi:type II secretory pathway pseudopilin PulG
MWSSERGATLVDLVAACAVAGILAAVSIPSIQAARERDEPRLAARYLAQRLQLLRVHAIRRNRMVAMHFDPDVVGRMTPYADGDGDGVLQNDIDRGVDTPIEMSGHLSDYFAGVSLLVRSDVPSPDGSDTVAGESDPVRIGSTNVLSFSPLGSATSGTIYLAARAGPQMCVRVLGGTGRVRVLWFDVASGAWRQD